MTRRNGRLGKRYNRRGNVGGMGLAPNPLYEKRVKVMRQMLATLKYTLGTKAILNFQRDFNVVRKYASELGGPISESGAYDSATYGALKHAVMFDQNMSKTWIFYVKKFRTIMGSRTGMLGKRKSKITSSRSRSRGSRSYSGGGGGKCNPPCKGGAICRKEKGSGTPGKYSCEMLFKPGSQDPLGLVRGGRRLRASSKPRRPRRRRLRRRSR